MIKKNTKMKWAVLIFLVLIASLLTWRIYYVNQNVPKVQTEYYDENDSVSMDRGTGDETDTKLKNYIVKVESTQLMDKDEFDKNEWTIYGDCDTTLVINKPNTVELTCASIVNRIPDVINAPAGFVPTSRMGELKYIKKES